MPKRLAAILWASLLLRSLHRSGGGARAGRGGRAALRHHALHLGRSRSPGDVGAKGHTADVSASFSDFLEHLNAALMGTVEARQDRFIVLFDGFGAWLEDDVNHGARTDRRAEPFRS